jgi:hypothetical protein
MTSLEDAIMTYLTRDITEHGGTGRRLTKIHLHMKWDGPPFDDHEFGKAIRALELASKITIEEHDWIGFVYAIPTGVS